MFDQMSKHWVIDKEMVGFRIARNLVPKVRIYKLLTSVSSIFIWKFIH